MKINLKSVVGLQISTLNLENQAPYNMRLISKNCNFRSPKDNVSGIILLFCRQTSHIIYLALNVAGQKFGCNNWVVAPLSPNLLNKVNDSSLPYFHYFFPYVSLLLLLNISSSVPAKLL